MYWSRRECYCNQNFSASDCFYTVCGQLLTFIKKGIHITLEAVDFSEGEVLLHLNGFFISDDCQGMLEKKYYQCIDIDFLSFRDVRKRLVDVLWTLS